MHVLEAHLRQLIVVGSNAGWYIADFSSEFQSGFVNCPCSTPPPPLTHHVTSRDHIFVKQELEKDRTSHALSFSWL
jgi:hypothetical protein